MIKIFLLCFFMSVTLMADAQVTLQLSGTVYDRGYTITNGWLIPSQGYMVTVNGVNTTTKVKLTPNVDYKIIVEAL